MLTKAKDPAELSPEELTTVRPVEDLRKTRKEIQKLEAEVVQLTKPYRTVPFYFTCVTTVFSAIAATAAIYGVLVQTSNHSLEVTQFQNKIDELRGNEKDLNRKLTTLKGQTDEAKVALTQASVDLEKTHKARQAADDSLTFFAKHSVRIHEYLDKQAKAQSGRADSEQIQYARGQLAEFLNLLKEQKYSGALATLTHTSPEVRRYGALILSRLDKKNVPSFAERTAHAETILASLLSEKDLDTKRLEITAVARLGVEAAPPLLEKLKLATGESRLNVIRALGELGAEATDPVIAAVIMILREDDKQLQREAVLALGAIGPGAGRAEEAIIRLLPTRLDGLLNDHEAYSLSKAVISSLRKLGTPRIDSIMRLLPFLDLVDRAGDNRLRHELYKETLMTIGAMERKSALAAARALQTVVRKCELLLRTESDFDLRQQAALTLAKIDTGEAFAGFVRSNVARDALPALVALTALESAADRKAHLATLLKTKSENFPSPYDIFALKSRGKDAIPVLLDALALVNDAVIRENLVVAIGAVGEDSEAVVPALVGALGDRKESIQVAAIRSLQRVGAAARGDVKQALSRLATGARVSDVVSRAAKAAVFTVVPPEMEKDGELTVAASSFGDSHKWYYAPYPRLLENGYIYQIDVKSREFDAFLLVKKDGKTLDFDDDSGGNYNAQLYFDPPATDTYEIWATSYTPMEVGKFRVEIRKAEKTYK